MSDCTKTATRTLRFKCRLGSGHGGRCSPYTLSPRPPADDNERAALMAMLRGARDDNATPSA